MLGSKGNSFMKKSLLLLLVCLLAAPAAHANLSVVCTANGKKTANSGGGLLPTQAQLEFDVESVDRVMTLQGVQGTIKVGAIDADGPLTKDNAYIGHFEITEISSNPAYRPRRYKNMVQFRHFDARNTDGMEDGMWGQFLIDKSLGDGCEAVYIFQAGDHMGGVMHFTCRVQD